MTERQISTTAQRSAKSSISGGYFSDTSAASP